MHHLRPPRCLESDLRLVPSTTTLLTRLSNILPLQCYIPTVRVQLVLVGSQSAIVLVIRYAIIVVIIVARVPFTVLVVVSLVGIGHIGTVVQVVLMAILIDVLVVVTLISHQVIVYVGLTKERSLSMSCTKVCECMYRHSHWYGIPDQGCAAMGSCHTGPQLRPCPCPSGQCCTRMGSCHSRSGCLRKKGTSSEFKEHINCI